MPTRKTNPPHAPEKDALGFERIVFFSDAVMAIAITLLAIDLKAPETASAVSGPLLAEYLRGIAPRIMSFVISFTVVGIYWMAHHRNFHEIRRYDNRLLMLNLIFLLFIALMPFVASLLGQFGIQPLGVIAYAATVAGTGYAISAIWWYASNQHRLVDANLEPFLIRSRNLVGLIIPTVFLISIPCALINPFLGIAVWWTSPFILIAVRQRSERVAKKLR